MKAGFHLCLVSVKCDLAQVSLYQLITSNWWRIRAHIVAVNIDTRKETFGKCNSYHIAYCIVGFLCYICIINPFPHIDACWRLCSKILFNTLWQKEKLCHIVSTYFSNYTFIYRVYLFFTYMITKMSAPDLLYVEKGWRLRGCLCNKMTIERLYRVAGWSASSLIATSRRADFTWLDTHVTILQC